jgi:hypothetical protein
MYINKSRHNKYHRALLLLFFHCLRECVDSCEMGLGGVSQPPPHHLLQLTLSDTSLAGSCPFSGSIHSPLDALIRGAGSLAHSLWLVFWAHAPYLAETAD